MKTQSVPAADPQALTQAIAILEQGGLVAFPTDTVYGLGALLRSESIEQIYEVKGRDSAKAIPILLGSPEQLSQVAQVVDERIRKLAQRFWPGPLTLVVPRRPELPQILSPYPTVGVRMPGHPVALALLQRCGPLAVTSANLSERSSATTADEVLAQLSGRIPLVLDGGRTPGGTSSTVVDCTTPALKILRQGPISLQELLEALK